MRQYRSRLSQVEESKSIKSAFIFGGLTILIIAVAVIFGISFLPKIVGIFVKPSSSTSTQQDVTLLPPNLSLLPQYTKEQSIVVKGTAAPNSTIKIFFGPNGSGSSSDEVVADANGNFAANVGLTKGDNVIYAKTIDANGNSSNNSPSFTVNFSNQIPNLTVTTPQNNQTFYGSTQQNINITGSTDANDTVTVNDHIAILDNNNKFNLVYSLQSGDNQLKIISTDPAGNKKEIDLKITFNP